MQQMNPEDENRDQGHYFLDTSLRGRGVLVKSSRCGDLDEGVAG